MDNNNIINNENNVLGQINIVQSNNHEMILKITIGNCSTKDYEEFMIQSEFINNFNLRGNVMIFCLDDHYNLHGQIKPHSQRTRNA